MAYLAPALDRVRDLILGAAGTAPCVVPAGLFRLPVDGVARCEADACERAVECVVQSGASHDGRLNPLDGRDLRDTRVDVLVSYRYHPEGSLDATVDAAVLGGASLAEIHARASEDAAVLLGALAWQPNFSGLTPEVIDFQPDTQGWNITAPSQDRVILTIPFVLTTRAAYPGSYGPVAS